MSNIKRFLGKPKSNKYFSEVYNEEFFVEELPEFITGSGCFGKGTLVLTAVGFKAIDRLTLKDKIIGYDRFGEVDFARISKITVHKKNEFVDDVYFINTVKGSVWPKGITGNHAVYDTVNNSHKEIKDFKLGDSLTDYNGNLTPITSISVIQHSDLSEGYEVYDLTVTPQHTFFCGTEQQWIRVHNSGGGKSSQSTNMSTGIEAPNTLQAASVAYVLELISHGPIVGINGGSNIAQGVYFNNTLVESTQGQQNFTGYILISGYYTDVYPFIAATTGTPDQPVLAGFTDIETTIYGGNQLIPYASSAGLIVTIPDSGKQAARVTLNFANGLWQQFYSNGNIDGYTVSFTIKVKSASGYWYPVVNTSLSGKTTSQYMVDYIVQAPPECLVNPNLEWAIQVVRNTPDDTISTVQATQSTFYLFSVTEILYQQNNYPNMALVGIQVPAIAVGNSIPTRGYFVTGMIVQVPSNYDPVNRTYGGSLADPLPPGRATQTYAGASNAGSANAYWDGTFKWAWTDNPAWILYDIISNNSYGLGEYLGQGVPINKWNFYEASLYNDCTSWSGTTKLYTKQLIPDGSASSWTVTDVRTDGSIIAYITAPGNYVSVGDTVTLSGIPSTPGLNVVTGAYTAPALNSLNTTYGVSSIIDSDNFTIVLGAAIAASQVHANGMSLLDNTTAGFEHRYLFNAPLTSQQDAWQLIQAIASNMQAIVTVINGEVVVVQDRPKPTTRFFNNTNVIGGMFTYSSSEVTSRPSVVNCTFNDKNNLYLPKTISEWDDTSIGLYGFIANDIVAFGCVDESQARRLARASLFAGITQQDIISFTTGLTVLDLAIGTVIGTQDNNKIRPASEFLTGRVINCTGIGTTSVTFTFDRAVTLAPISSTDSSTSVYNFAITAPDGIEVLAEDGVTSSLQSYLWVGVITSPTVAGTYNSVVVEFQEQVGFTAISLPACSTGYIGIDFYAYASNSGENDLWMVQAIAENQRGQYTITGILYNPHKWDTVEGGLSFTPVKLPSGLLSTELPSPGTIIFQPVFTNNGITTASYLLISWGWNQTVTDQVQFNLSYQINNGNWVNASNLANNSYEIANPVPGTYNVLIQAVNLAGVQSPQVYNSYNYYISSTNFTPITGQTGNLQGNADINGAAISKNLTIGTVVNAGNLVIGNTYVVQSMGVNNPNSSAPTVLTDFTLVGANPGAIPDGDFNPGTSYNIYTLGTTNWNLIAGTIGLTYTVGETFIAKVASSSGTGTAYASTFGVSIVPQGTQFVATGAGTGSGTALSVTANTSAWDTYAFSSVGYTSSFAVQFQFATLTSECAAGLDTSITGTTLNTLLFGIYVDGTGLIYTTIGIGVLSASLGTYAVTDIFEVAYSAQNNTISFYKNGTPIGVVISFTLSASAKLYFKSVYNTPGSGINNLQIGTYTPSILSDLSPPVNFQVIGATGTGTELTSFTGQDLQVTWDENPANKEAVVSSYNSSSTFGASGTNVIPLLNTLGITVGDTASGTGLATGATVVSINTIANTVEVSYNLSVNASGSYTFNVTVSTLYQYVLEIIVGTTIANTYIVPVNAAKTGGFFDYTYARNQADNGGTASRSVTMRVFAQDTLGHVSTNFNQQTFTNPQAAAPFTFTIIALNDAISITIIPDNETDIAGYVVWRGTTIGFTKNAASQVYNGVDLSVTLPTPDSVNTYHYAVGEYDTFGQDNIVASSEKTAISIGTTAINWSISGNPFTVAGDVLSWTAFTVYQNGTANAIASGSLTVTPTTVTYFYFDPSVSITVLQHTTVTATAVGPGTYPIATFDGVNLKGGDGSAFISGSQVLAGTLAGSAIEAGSIFAMQLSTSTAVITTNAQIAAATIGSANIKNYIQSTNYSTTMFTGFKLETGNSGGAPALNMYAGAFNLYDNTGNLIFSASTKFNGAYIQNASINTAQIANASIGVLQLAGHIMTIPSVYTLGATYNSGSTLPHSTWITIPNFALGIDDPGILGSSGISWLIQVNLIGTIGIINAIGIYLRILFDGNPVAGFDLTDEDPGTLPNLITAVVTDTTAGWHVITVQCYASTSVSSGHMSLTVQQGSSIVAQGAAV